MNITVKRFSDNGESTIGLLYIDDKFYCYTIEDEYREEKVSGETRIPDGNYEVKFRRVLSGMTKKYRAKFDWFTWHLELQNVEGFKYVYFHKGNTSDHSDGCIIIGDTANNNNDREGFVGRSTTRYKEFYEKLEVAINNDDKIMLKVESIEKG